MVNRPRHGKAEFRWCDSCGTLLLGKACDACGAEGRPFLVSFPGDIRPALTSSHGLVQGLVERHFGAGAALEGRPIFLNKVAGEDRTDEIVVGGSVVGTLRFDLQKQDFLLELKADGALLLVGEAKRGKASLRHQSGHLKGKNVPPGDVLGIDVGVRDGDPVIAVSGGLVCSAKARVACSLGEDCRMSVHIREVGKTEDAWSAKPSTWAEFVNSNLSHLKAIESKAVSDVKSFASNRKEPVTLSFSGGKDSLACYGIAKRALKAFTLVFIDTGLEFPETVRYVREFAEKRRERLLVASAGDAFWEQVGAFGPPAKDFRWCCKVCKLAPLTEAIGRDFPEGTVTIEGNRALESFARSDIGFVESNPFVPNQTILNPIRGWVAAEVWAYIWWKGLDYNPLYDKDYERIGCYLCPACLSSEWRSTARLHPDLHARWERHLAEWAEENGAGGDFVRYGFWRWKVLPPKMRKLAEEADLKVPSQRADSLRLRLVKGVSPCVTGGYSVEGIISMPTRRSFSKVGEALKAIGKTRVSEEYGVALTKAGKATIKAFAGGQVVASAPTPELASRAFESGVKAFLRAQLCTKCGICVKNCDKKAIVLDDGIEVDEGRCVSCGKCVDACVVAHYYDKLVAEEDGKARASQD
ncbi:MAG TPA: phosphoadenosine phosphosulfate reductase family protein [Methanomassiliicoccales archaeon]|nr:phosphoadenosine phosphosulfate reductase family protein [Methanomassiliicoccales archaeon]